MHAINTRDPYAYKPRKFDNLFPDSVNKAPRPTESCRLNWTRTFNSSIAITHRFGLSACCCVELSLHRRQDALPKTPAMLSEVLIDVEQAQLVLRPLVLLFDCPHRCLVRVSENHLVHHESEGRTFKKERGRREHAVSEIRRHRRMFTTESVW